jgi:hypothetical protein
MTRARKTSLSFCVLASFAVAVSCREPTQVTVRVSTGARCSDLSSVELVVGPDQKETQQRFEKQFTTAVTRDCDASGFIGTLVVAPGGSTATIVVAVGVKVGGAPAPEPSACADGTAAQSCIIARRSFAFIDHTSLMLPVLLDLQCVGKTCDPASTCFKGTCVDASVICNGSDCGLVQEHPGEGNGSGGEAGSSDGAYDADLDGSSFEDVTPHDAAGDDMANTDAQIESGTDSGLYPPCGGGGATTFCAGNEIAGKSTLGGCTVQTDLARKCCHCTCPSTAIVNCELSASAPASTACSVSCL